MVMFVNLFLMKRFGTLISWNKHYMIKGLSPLVIWLEFDFYAKKQESQNL